MQNATSPRVFHRLRGRAGIAKSSKQASAALPLMVHGKAGRCKMAEQPLAAVVLRVSVACPFALPEIVTGLVEPKLNVGGFCAPLGLEVTAAVSATLPVKPLTGVTVMMLVLPPPAVTKRLDGEGKIVKPGIGAALTVRAMVVDSVRLQGSPQETPPWLGALPRIVTVASPVAAVLLAARVSTLELVVGLVAKDAVTPLGRPDAVRVTASLNPFAPVTMMLLVPLAPCVTVKVGGEA
jgi:hypothetical protein